MSWDDDLFEMRGLISDENKDGALTHWDEVIMPKLNKYEGIDPKLVVRKISDDLV